MMNDTDSEIKLRKQSRIGFSPDPNIYNRISYLVKEAVIEPCNAFGQLGDTLGACPALWRGKCTNGVERLCAYEAIESKRG